MARFFARLRSAVLECPGGCGRLYDLRATKQASSGQDAGPLSRRYWDPLSGRFECPGCGQVCQLGIVAYSLPAGRTTLIPADWRPTIPQAVWMRDQARGRVEKLPKGEQGANLVEAADWQDTAELGAELPPVDKPRRGRPLTGGSPGVRSAPAAPTYGSTWRKPKGPIEAPEAAGEAEEEDPDDVAN